MKRIYYLLIILFALAITNCRKESQVQKDTNHSMPFSDSAIQFLKSQLSKEDFASLDTASMNFLKYNKTNVAIRVFQRGTSGQRFVILQKSLGTFGVNLRRNVSNVT